MKIRWTSWAPQFLSILRIVSALLFIPVGTMKLFAWPMGIPPNGGTVPWMSQMGVGGVLEVVGGVLLLVVCAALGPRVAAVLEGGYRLETLPGLVAAALAGFDS